MNRKLIICLTVITILSTTSLLGCSANKAVTPAKGVTTQSQVPAKNSATTTATDTAKATTAAVPATVPLSQLNYTISSIPTDTKIALNTPWETSPLGKYSALILGKGAKANEEGYSQIIIKDEKAGTLIKLTLQNEEKNQIAAKDLEWIDDSNMFVIIGGAYGTISRGGKIYEVNITTGVATLYLNTTSSKEEYTHVDKKANGYSFEKYVYDDANFTKGHTESGTFELK